MFEVNTKLFTKALNTSLKQGGSEINGRTSCFLWRIVNPWISCAQLTVQVKTINLSS